MGARLAPWQRAVYEAEAEGLHGHGITWRRLPEARRYLQALTGSTWFQERWPHLRCCGLERRGSDSRWSLAHGLDADGAGGLPTEGVILLASGPPTQSVVLHELAHLLTPRGTGHRRPFLDAQLELVRHEMGFFAYSDYRAALAARGLLGAPVTAVAG